MSANTRTHAKFANEDLAVAQIRLQNAQREADQTGDQDLIKQVKDITTAVQTTRDYITKRLGKTAG